MFYREDTLNTVNAYVFWAFAFKKEKKAATTRDHRGGRTGEAITPIFTNFYQILN